jgi:hypothetical protein
MEENIPINNLSGSLKNFNFSSHKFIKDPNFKDDGDIEELLKTTDQTPINLDEKSMIESAKMNRPKITDERFKERMLKDTFKYLYYRQKLSHLPEFKEHKKKLAEIDKNVLTLTYMSTLYGLFLIFRIIDRSITFYDRIDDIINDRPKTIPFTNKAFHISASITLISLIFWNFHQTKKLETEFQQRIKTKYLSNMRFSEKHPQKVLNMKL